jgi:hypothetical protein
MPYQVSRAAVHRRRLCADAAPPAPLSPVSECTIALPCPAPPHSAPPLVRAGRREQPCHCARPSCRAVVSNRVCHPRRLHPHELGHTTLPCAGESLFGAAHRHRPLSAACRCEIAAVPTVVRARVLLAASACSCAMGRHAKSWAAHATVHAGLHSPVQRATSVLCSRAGWIRPFAFKCFSVF